MKVQREQSAAQAQESASTQSFGNDPFRSIHKPRSGSRPSSASKAVRPASAGAQKAPPLKVQIAAPEPVSETYPEPAGEPVFEPQPEPAGEAEAQQESAPAAANKSVNFNFRTSPIAAVQRPYTAPIRRPTEVSAIYTATSAVQREVPEQHRPKSAKPYKVAEKSAIFTKAMSGSVRFPVILFTVDLHRRRKNARKCWPDIHPTCLAAPCNPFRHRTSLNLFICRWFCAGAVELGRIHRASVAIGLRKAVQHQRARAEPQRTGLPEVRPALDDGGAGQRSLQSRRFSRVP